MSSTAKTFEADGWMKARPIHIDADGFRLTDEVMRIPAVQMGRSRGSVKSFDTTKQVGVIESFDGGRDVHFVGSELRGTDFLNEGDIVDFTADAIGIRNTANIVMVVHRA